MNTFRLVVVLLLQRAFFSPVFAQEPFPPFDRDEYPIVNSVAFSADGDELFFALLYHSYLENRGLSIEGAPETAMFSLRRDGEVWSDPELMSFSGQYDDYEPTLSADGQLIVFNSKRPYADGRQPEINDLWMSARGDDGEWGTPMRVQPITSFLNEESYASLSSDNQLVFMQSNEDPSGRVDHDLYYTRVVDGSFQPARRHPVSSAEFGEGDPWLARDGSYLIYTRWDDDIGWGDSVDLYASFYHGETWSEPVALATLNTPAAEFGVAVSADEQWLHYYRDYEILTVPLQPILERYRP